MDCILMHSSLLLDVISILRSSIFIALHVVRIAETHFSSNETKPSKILIVELKKFGFNIKLSDG